MTAREQMPGPGRELLQDNGSMKTRPGDGFLAEVSRRAALTAHQQKAGEETMVGPARTHGTHDMDWRARGACRFSDPEMFFPVAENGPEFDQAVAAAKQVCAGCPVRAECAAWAIAALPHGVAGGMSADERHHARNQRPPLATPACRSTAPRVEAAVSRRPSRTRSRRIVDGQAALARGVAREQVASEFGVSRRTVDRWAAEDRRSAVTGGASVSGGGRR